MIYSIIEIMGNMCLRMELGIKENSIKRGNLMVMVFCTILMIKFAILEAGKTTLFMASES